MYPLTITLSPTRFLSAPSTTSGGNFTDASRGNKYLVALATIHHLRVARHDLHAGYCSCGAHRIGNTLQLVCRQPLFK